MDTQESVWAVFVQVVQPGQQTESMGLGELEAVAI